MSEGSDYEVPIRGLHCGGCVTRLTRVLEHQPGVRSVEVSLLENKARLSVDSSDALAGVLTAIEGAGFYPGSPEAGQGSTAR